VKQIIKQYLCGVVISNYITYCIYQSKMHLNWSAASLYPYLFTHYQNVFFKWIQKSRRCYL